MKPIHLDNFEREIKEIILNRGFFYFEDSKVSFLSKFGDITRSTAQS